MRADRKRHVIAVATGLSALLACSASHAFCRTTTVPPPVGRQSQECWLEGMPLYHSSQCLPYRLLTKESPAIPNAVLSDKLARAFNAWSAPNPMCSPGITAIELAPSTATTIVGYTSRAASQNLVGVPDTWTHAGAQDTLSLATLTFDWNTGEVFDVDVEVNGSVAWSFGDTPPANGFDLEAALTHEVGHMLGFAHSPVGEATMFAAYTPGDVAMRTLAADDQQAICTAYPNRSQRLAASGLVPSTACNLAPGDSSQGCGDPEITHGCSTAPGRSASTVPIGLGLVIAVGGLAARRRARRARLD